MSAKWKYVSNVDFKHLLEEIFLAGVSHYLETMGLAVVFDIKFTEDLLPLDSYPSN